MSNFRKYLLLSLVVALLNAVFLLVFYVPRFTHTDTQGYVSTIKYFAGDPQSEVVVFRILKPLPILIGALLNPFLEAKNTLVAQNLVFYFLSVWLIFLLVYYFYHNEKQAFYGTVLYTTAYPMLAYGLAPLTDLPGWFFYLLVVWLSLNYFKKPDVKKAFIIGLIGGIGMLFKENVVAAPIFFVSLLFLATQLPIKEKLKYVLVFGIAFLFFPFINSILMYKFYFYSYLDWFRMGGIHNKRIGGGFYMVSFFRIIIETGRVFLIGWIFVLFGILKEFTLKNIKRIKILLAFIPPSLSVFLWSFPHNRILFIAFPFLVLLGSFGVLRNYKNPKTNNFIELFLLFLYVLLNYGVLEFLLRYGPIIQPPGTLFG